MSPHARVLLTLLAFGASVLAPARSPAQATSPDAPSPSPRGEQAEAGEDAKAPPALRLGLRLLAVSNRLPVAPTLVIVPDAAAYLGALERWEIGATWPVLIDDGSDGARENIARFVRAYEPERILRWAPPEDAPPPATALPQRIEAIVARAWGAPSPDALRGQWATLGFEPPGIIVASEGDPAWTAAAALAAGHGQPIVWIDPPAGRPAQRMEPPALDALDGALLAGLRERGWAWEALGDAIEGVTLCLNAPARIDGPDGERGTFALTDRIGRHPDGRRYAWCGLIFGSASEAAYRAMCALFLSPQSGWVFDGYDAGYPAPYDAERALSFFERRGFPVVFTSARGATLDVWRGRVRGGIDGGYVHVNSAGHATWFQLAGKERAFASETPLLNKPGIVHFIHSFSARWADNPTTISGRWLQNGAYAYIGSVDEPTLGAFVPPEVYFGRLFSGAPLGAAGRHDGAPAWKIQVIGDPLIIAAGPRPRRDVEPGLEGAVSLETLMKEALEDRRFAEAVAMLVMQGRDDDALRVARAALEEGEERVDVAGIARAAVAPAFRAQDAALFARLYPLLPPTIADDDGPRSMLWQILRPGLEAGQREPRTIALLRRHIRAESAVEDATTLRPALLDLHGPASVNAMFTELIEQARNDRMRRELRKAMGGG